MATLTIRNLPDEQIEQLKLLAKRHHRSMEQEAREIIKLATADRLIMANLVEHGWEKMQHQISVDDLVAHIGDDRAR